MSEREQILQSLLEIAAEAALLVNQVYQTEFSVDYKAPEDPVTLADRSANALICRRLAERFPGVPVVAEESDPATFAGYGQAPRVFFVDPLDGTREFVDRNGEFAVMIGLLEGDRPSVGVIHAPVPGTAWGGIVGAGAWAFGAGGARTPIQVSAQSQLSETRIVASRSHRSSLLEQALQMLGARRLDPLGSAGLKCAEVAIGMAEAYVSPGPAGQRWDVCAGEAIVVAAGGRASDALGNAIDYRSPTLTNDAGFVASNGRIHAQILERIRAIRDAAR
jgi:3'(2'), 5'-bisphosphate nucleotidase